MKLTINRYDFILLIALTVALFSTIFNSYHLPLGFDLYHNLIIAVIVTIGLTGSFLYYSREIKIPYSIGTWILLLGLIILQPFIHSISYPDSLVFPMGALLLTIILSIAVANIEDKNTFLDYYLFIFAGFMLLSVAIQFMQLRGYSLVFYDLIIFKNVESSRLDANFSQPNQAAFMLALAELACLYFYSLYKNKIWLLSCALFIIGIAFTTSRGGLILGLAAIVLFNTCYNQSLHHKIKNSAVQLLAFTAVYSIGVFILKTFKVSSNVSNSAIERFSEGSLGARISLQEQAYLLFHNKPLTGYGWGGFIKGSINHATELSSFVFSKHSHFFVSQIASELGVIGLLCLVPITIFVVKKVSFKMDAFNAVCFTAILIVILYSCSEFPLWFLRFLIIFAFFVTLIDTKHIYIKKSYSKLFAAVAFSMSLIIIFYMSSHMKIYRNIIYLAINDLTSVEIEEVYANTPDVFGMSAFKESILFHYIPIDSDAIDGKLAIAERSTATSVTQRGIFRYARLLALNNKPEKSVAMFKAACALNWRGDCDNVIDELDIVAEKEPQVYGKIKYEIDKWVIDFDPKKLK